MTKEKKIYRTCGPESLETFTRDGWTLAKILQSDRMIDVQESVAAYDEAPEGSSNGYRCPGWQHTSVTKKVVVMDTIFLLEKDESTVIAELEAKIKDAEAKASAADVEKKKAEKDLLEEKGASQRLSAAAIRSQELHAKLLADTEEIRKTKARMEADLGKIRLAVGELRMREIVGGPA